jgi:carboxylesterase type B
MSVGSQILAFGGRNDSLFRAAIADSGGPLGAQPPTSNESLATWDSIVDIAGCSSSADQISCLRRVPVANYTNAVNQTSGSYSPVYDGDFLPTYNSEQVKSGEFLKVPLIIGSNVDEGTEFVGGAPYIGAAPSTTYPNTTSFLSVAKGYVRNTSQLEPAIAALSVLYPDIPAIGVPHSYHGRLNSTFGAQYARVATLAGDLAIHRGRRLSAQSWSKHDVPVYSYNFAAWPIGGLPDFTGTTHFTEIQLVFDNEDGNGYLYPWYPSGSEFTRQGKAFTSLARLMSRLLYLKLFSSPG